VSGHAPRASDALALHRDTIREVLPNGLTLLVRRDRTAPVVAIVTHVKAGYFDETDDVVGIAHVLEHMFFKGTPTRGVGQIARETKGVGGYLNAHTIYDHTTYYTVLPSSSLVQGLDVQFDAYARSVIDADELARELEVIIQEAKRKRDSAYPVTIESLYALLHDRHRIRRWRIGEESGLRTLTRDQLLAFYRTWYQPESTILSIVGDVDPATVRREVMRRHGAMAPSAPATRDRGPEEVTLPGIRHREWEGDIAQQHTAFGWRAPSMHHPDTPALDVAAIALGSGRASRLYRAVRESQLASAVTAWHYNADRVGVFVVHAEGDADSARDAGLATWREVQAARMDGVRRREVVRAQRILEARWLRRLESMDGQAQYLASWEAEGGLDIGAAYYDALSALDSRRVHEALVTHLDPSQVAVASYRPHGAAPLATSLTELEAMLATPVTGSAVMPSPMQATPISTEAVATSSSPTRHSGGRQTPPLEHGVYRWHTATGVPVLLLPRPGSPLVNVGVVQRGGAVLDGDAHEGLSRITAQAMLKGTSTRTGAQIAEASEELGGSIGVSVGLESMSWSLSVPVRHWQTAITLMADVVQHPVFHDDAIEIERTLALAELARVRDDMYRWPLRLAAMAAYGAHPYARSVVGTDTSLPRIQHEEVRDFHARQLLQGSSVIAIVGDLSPDDVAAQIDQQFPLLVWHAGSELLAPSWPSTAQQLYEHRAKQQTALALLFPGPSRRDPDRFAARVLSAIASGLGGRFFEQLRDKQSLAYTVSAFPMERRAAGAFAAYIATSPAREEEAREGLKRQFALLQDAPPLGEELERAQRYLIGSHAIAQQSGASVLGELVDAELFGDGLHELAEIPARLAAVTANDVQALAHRYFALDRVAEGVVRGA
jgi:zinc protease